MEIVGEDLGVHLSLPAKLSGSWALPHEAMIGDTRPGVALTINQPSSHILCVGRRRQISTVSPSLCCSEVTNHQ